MDQLPDLILLEILDQVPQLSLVNRKLFYLGELLTRNRLLHHCNFGEHLVESLAADIRSHLGFGSWCIVENIVHRNYCIFGPEHVRASQWLENGTPPKGFHAVHGAPFGLYVLDWSKRKLEYKTTLREGRYRLYLDVFFTQISELCQTRFQFVDSPRVKQYFPSIPPLNWLQKQSQCMDPTEMEATKIYMGMIDVIPDETCEENMCTFNNWSDVTLQIESLDWLDNEAPGLIFNYLCIEKYPMTTCSDFDWSIQSPNAGPPSPTYALARLYKRVNERKMQWSITERSRHRIHELPS